MYAMPETKFKKDFQYKKKKIKYFTYPESSLPHLSKIDKCFIHNKSNFFTSVTCFYMHTFYIGPVGRRKLGVYESLVCGGNENKLRLNRFSLKK